VQRVHKVLGDIEILARCTSAKVGEISEWSFIVSSAEIRADFCKALDGKPLCSAVNGMYTVTLNELKAVLMVSAQARQSSAVNKTSVELTAQDDDLCEIKRRKKLISNNTSQTTKKSAKPVPTSTAVKLPPKSVLTGNFFAPLRTTDMDMETTDAENTLPKQEAPRKPGRPPPIVMTSTTNRIRLQSDLKEHVKGEYVIRNTRNGTRIITKEPVEYSLMKSLPGEK
jgi:hypothetical protein